MASLPPPLHPVHARREAEFLVLHQRFWSKVEIAGPDDCWLWTACLCKAGYGRFGAGRQLGGPTIWVASRVAYILTNGRLRRNRELDHVCHTRDLSCVTGSRCPHRGCVNPSHLEPVTHHENAIRREARRLTCSRGHLRHGNRGSNGIWDRCKVCHRIKMGHFRETGTYAWPEVVA